MTGLPTCVQEQRSVQSPGLWSYARSTSLTQDEVDDDGCEEETTLCWLAARGKNSVTFRSPFSGFLASLLIVSDDEPEVKHNDGGKSRIPTYGVTHVTDANVTRHHGPRVPHNKDPGHLLL